MQIEILIYLFFTTIGVVLMKIGGDSLSLVIKQGINFKIGYITFLGFLAYIVSFLLWQRIVVNNNISTIFAITSGILQILLFFIGVGFFKEEFHLINFFGIVFIIIGIFLVTYK